MRGVERTPVGIEAVVELAIGEGHLVAAPVEREARVAAFRVRHDCREIGRLAAAVDVHQAGQGGGAFRKSVERRDGRGLAFEGADAIADDPADDAVLFPFFGHFGFDRFLARIKISPQRVEILWRLAVLQRRQRLRTEVGQQG